MNKLNHMWLLAIALFIYPAALYAQRAEAPTYKDGDWWRVKYEVTRVGFSVSGPCSETFSDYIVKIVDKRPFVFGMKADQQIAIECPLMIRLVLGGRDLKFPLYVGLSWSLKEMRQVPGLKPMSVDSKYEVSSWGKINTLKGELGAFKIVKSFPISPPAGKAMQTRWQIHTYYYAPSVKAVVQYRAEDEGLTATTSLEDFEVTQ